MKESLSLIPSTKIYTVEEALRSLKSNQVVVAAMAAAEPTSFFQKLHTVAQNLQQVTVYCANPLDHYTCFHDDIYAGHLAFNVMFLTSPIRDRQGRGFVHYVPQHLSQWTKNLFAKKSVDVFWGSCSLPDARGFVSLGVGACYETEVIRRAKTVILEVNERMPVTYGATTFPIDKVSMFISNHHDLPILPVEVPDEIDHEIARRVCDLVSDGATIQLGIGAIPNALGEALKRRKNLGVHTELINDAIMKLGRSGIVTNECKSIWPDKMVGAFVYGSKDLYDFVHKNPTVELQPASVVNDPYRIGRNYKMTSINTAVEIDITGQVCSESIGHQELSGVGGASDTHVGAQRSEGGRGVIAMRSTTKKGQSKIVFELLPGAKVSISRNDIDTVVTEFGVAELKGKTVSERAQALAAIAHPNFREKLLANAKAARYI